MSNATKSERRRYTRRSRVMNLRMHHLPSQRDFPARSLDASVGGMKMDIPATTPASVGQSVELLFAGPTGEGSARMINATIVRVDRQTLLTRGKVTIGVEFAQPQKFLAA
jgi:c-di-GMP-binding flagellar brake protein YcgR